MWCVARLFCCGRSGISLCVIMIMMFENKKITERERRARVTNHDVTKRWCLILVLDFICFCFWLICFVVVALYNVVVVGYCFVTSNWLVVIGCNVNVLISYLLATSRSHQILAADCKTAKFIIEISTRWVIRHLLEGSPSS